MKLLGSLSREDLIKICGDNFPQWISFPAFEQVLLIISVCFSCIVNVQHDFSFFFSNLDVELFALYSTMVGLGLCRYYLSLVLEHVLLENFS